MILSIPFDLNFSIHFLSTFLVNVSRLSYLCLSLSLFDCPLPFSSYCSLNDLDDFDSSPSFLFPFLLATLSFTLLSFIVCLTKHRPRAIPVCLFSYYLVLDSRYLGRQRPSRFML